MEETSYKNIVEIYCDGGVIKKNPSEIGGTWAFVCVDAEGNVVVEKYGAVPSPANRKITNNHTEQIAIVKALEEMPDGWSGKVCSDSMVALGRVFNGWAEKNLPKNISDRSKAAVARLGQIETLLLQGHPTKKDLEIGIGAKRSLPVSIHNKRCDELCGLAAREYLEKNGLTELKAELCKSCNKKILYLNHERTGNSNPIDAEPSKKGNLIVDLEAKTYRTATGNEIDIAQNEGEMLYISHFATCPNSDQHRNK